MENSTPSWQEYRDNMEIGAIIGGFAGLIASLSLAPGSEIALGPLFAGIAGGTFGTGAIAGFVTGVVRHLNGEGPSQQKSPCPSGYTCTPNTPTPTTKTQTDNDLGLFSSELMSHSLSVLLTYDSRSSSPMQWSESSVAHFAPAYSFASVEWMRLAAWYERIEK